MGFRLLLLPSSYYLGLFGGHQSTRHRGGRRGNQTLTMISLIGANDQEALEELESALRTLSDEAPQGEQP